MRIYFHIDELSRDGIVASVLKRECGARGSEVVYGNRVSNRLLPYFHSAFDVIIYPRPHLLYDIWGDKWINWKTKFVTLAAESVGVITKDAQVIARTLLEREYFEGNRKYAERIDAFCLWGEKQRTAIAKFAPELLSKMHVVGHPRHDARCIVRRNSRPHDPTVGIITRAVSLNDYYGRSALDPFCILLDEKFKYEFNYKKTRESLMSRRAAAKPADAIAVQSIDVKNTIEIINFLVGQGRKVTVRVHPKENALEWQRVLEKIGIEVKFSDPREPITSWLSGLNYIIGPPSTSFYDAVMLGVTPISISLIDERRLSFVDDLWEDNNCLMEFVFKPKLISELTAYIKQNNKLIMSDPVAKVLREEANFPDCSNSIRRIFEICELLVTRRSIKFEFCKCLMFWLYVITNRCFFFIWKLRRRFGRSRENSAIFAIDVKTQRFIEKLSRS